MALSDYLTSDEWDACFYVSFSANSSGTTFGATMHKVIDKLLSKGYEFQGLDGSGNKRDQIHGTGNPEKVCIWLGNPRECDTTAILTAGRKFLKKHAPEWVDETDEEWAAEVAKVPTSTEN